MRNSIADARKETHNPNAFVSHKSTVKEEKNVNAPPLPSVYEQCL